MSSATSADSREEALLGRLKALLRDHSQADLARRTDRSRNALTRYVHGAKLPLEFGAALVEEFGVNPAWLLSGEDPPYLADVPQTSTELGNELLEMMRAIDNVAKVKLGALTGRGHARALREVSDMLNRYGSLSDRLNSMSAPLLADLVARADEAAHARQMDRARAFLNTAMRLHKFCDDRELSLKLLKVRGLVYHIEQDLDAALELRARSFHMTLEADSTFESIADSAIELALVLRNSGFARRAQRVARIGQAYANAEDRNTSHFVLLQMVDVLASVELGEFQGIPEMIAHAMDVGADDAATEAARYQYNLYRGTWRPFELAGAIATNFAGASNMLTVSLLTEDAEVIERALKRCRELMQPQMLLNQYHTTRGELVLKALKGKPLPSERVALPTDAATYRNFTTYVNSALLLRLVGDRRAYRAIEATQRCLDDYPEDRTPLCSSVALHLANVLRGIKKDTRNKKHRELRAKAEAMLEQRINQGFGLLRILQG